MSRSTSSRSRSAGTFVIIIVIAGLLAAVSYEYTSYIANSITNSSVQSTNTSAQIEASETDHIFVNELNSVAKEVEILASSSAVREQNITAAIPLFSDAANATSEVTYSFFWGAPNGTLIIARNATSELTPTVGLNLTQRPYWAEALSSRSLYYSDVLNSTKGVPTIYVVQPLYASSVVDGQGTTTTKFEGIVAASLGVSMLGEYLQSQLPGNLAGGLGAVDPNGIVLYTANQSLIGYSVFGQKFQSGLPVGFSAEFDNFLHSSLGGGSGVTDLSYKGVTITFVYQSVYVGDPSTPSTPQLLAVLYIFAANQLAASQAAQISSVRTLFVITIIGIAAVALASAVVLLRWNRSLDAIVKHRTFDLVLANQALAAQSEAQRDMINIAAHELRTPTQSILTSSELLKDVLATRAPEIVPASSSGPEQMTHGSGSTVLSSVVPDEEVKALVDSSLRNALRLQQLVRNLLDVAQIDSHRVQLDLETFDLNEKTRQVSRDIQDIIEKESPPEGPSVKILVESQEDKLIVYADRLKTYEILSNLLRNAISHSNPGGTVVVSTSKRDNFALVSVRDDGKGISPDVLPRLFEKFVTRSGTGLGLFICKSYVTAQGGEIWAQNNSDVKAGMPGAIFSFTLPLASPTGEPGTPR